MKSEDTIQGDPRAPAARVPQSSVFLHIDRLVINGVPLSAVQGTQLQAAVQRELTRLLRQDSPRSLLHGGAVPTLVAAPILILTAFRPADLGRQIARCVHESLTRSV